MKSQTLKKAAKQKRNIYFKGAEIRTITWTFYSRIEKEETLCFMDPARSRSQSLTRIFKEKKITDEILMYISAKILNRCWQTGAGGFKIEIKHHN